MRSGLNYAMIKQKIELRNDKTRRFVQCWISISFIKQVGLIYVENKTLFMSNYDKIQHISFIYLVVQNICSFGIDLLGSDHLFFKNCTIRLLLC